MMKLAIVTLYGDLNFGNKLQNYATKILFEKYGFDVYTLPNVLNMKYSLRLKVYARNVLSLYRENNQNKNRQQLDNLRSECIKLFSQKYLNLYEGNREKISLRSLCREFDYFAAGSDQVWHYLGKSKSVLKYYLLYFARREQKITIAPSFSFNEVPKEYKDIYRKGLDDFQYLSVREDRGAEIIKELTGKEATVLLDPTMLIDTSEWLKILRKPSKYIDDKYIFVYALGGFKGEVKEKTAKLGADIGLRVIDIMDINSDYYIHTCPDEFLYWIYNARLIVTDSFHASVFSILFNRPFVVIERYDIKNMGSRLDTLFNKFGITDRHFDELKGGFDSAGETRDRLFTVNYSEVPLVLDAERKKAEEFYEMCFHKRTLKS